MVREAHVSHSRFRQLSELDKLIERIEMWDCEISNLTQGTGVRVFQMIGGTLAPTPGRQVQSQIRAHEISLRNVDVRAQGLRPGLAQLGFDAYAMGTVQIEGCTFYPDHEQGSAIMFGGELIFQPLAVTTETMTIARDEPHMQALIRAIDVGSKIVPAEANVADEQRSDEAFLVRSLAFDLNGNLVLVGHHRTEKPSGPIVLRRLLRVRQFVARNNLINAPPASFRFLRSTQSIEQRSIDSL